MIGIIAFFFHGFQLNLLLRMAFQRWQKYWSNDQINYSVKVCIALVGVVLPAWYRGATDSMTPMILGVVASALAEVDDRLWGRIKALIITLACFAVASLSIELLFAHPPLFAAGLLCSTFGFTMLGAMGPSYSRMSFASLLLAVYTMIGAGASPLFWEQPALLLAGALWYGVLSLMWYMLWPERPVRQSLAGIFTELAGYLHSKSRLFDPVANMRPQPLRLAEARKNAQVVNALNQAKATLLQRVRRQQNQERAFLRIYFLAQDIHERVSSSHYRYQDLAASFARSDVLFRVQKLLLAQADTCRVLAHSLTMGKSDVDNSDSSEVLAELERSLAWLHQQNNPDWHSGLVQLDYLHTNLATVNRLMSSVMDGGLATSSGDNSEAYGAVDELEMDDANPKSIKEHLLRIRNECRLDSSLFRHAVRLSIALTLGYGLILAMNQPGGFWIMLTTLFVCQPGYRATRQRLAQRVMGTVAGLLVGIPLMYLFPGQEGQLVLMVISGVLFFAFRTVRYDVATAFITLLVLLCFSQQGMGFAVVLPRLWDTLLGCLLALVAVGLILPDWESKRLSRIMAATIARHREYLTRVVEQYQGGKCDTLAYRVARRQAHNMDAGLNAAIMNMLAEPGRYQLAKDESYRFLTLSHALLSYISTLGAHRAKLADGVIDQALLKPAQLLDDHLRCLQQQLLGTSECDIPPTYRCVADDPIVQQNPQVQMLIQQFQLMLKIMPELHELACTLAGNGVDGKR